MDAVKNFLLAFLPFVAIYLGALSVVTCIPELCNDNHSKNRCND